MSAAVTTTTPRLRDLRVMGWMLTEIARRWPELIDSAIALAEREYSETFVDGFKELAAIDRFHTLRLVGFLAVCHAVDRGDHEWLPATLVRNRKSALASGPDARQAWCPLAKA